MADFVPCNRLLQKVYNLGFNKMAVNLNLRSFKRRTEELFPFI